MSETVPDAAEEAAPIAPPKVDPETLVLRARPARAIRFKRGVIAALGGTAAVAIVATAWFALEPHALHLVTESDDKSIAARPPSDTLSALPTGYGAIPKLGPPLPGDLGRPILDRQHQLATEMAPDTAPSNGQNVAVQNAAEERQRALTELKAARQSGLLVQNSNGGGQPAAAPAPIAPSAADEANQVGKVALDPERDPNGQQRKADFVRTTDKASDTNPYAVVAIPSPYTLSAGSVISASLITGLRSDLPGLVVAQVTERIFDSATGHILLIPQGAKLVGTYDSVVALGQSRALLVWQRIIFPDGSSLRLDNAPATDPSGYAGVADKVDFHTWSLLKGVVLSTLLGVGSELQFSGESDLVQAVRQSTQQNVSRAGDQITSRNLQVQPTITVRPGAPIKLLVHHDLVLKPWGKNDD